MPIKRLDKKRLHKLCLAMAKLESAADIESFLYDIGTPQELAEWADRWHIAQELTTRKKSYRTIAEETGVSVTTVTRVARFLYEEPHGGYRALLGVERQRA
jgi:uncharacterized protein YerC